MYKQFIYVLLFISGLKSEAQQADFKTINFKQADAIAQQYKGEDLNNLPLLAYNLTNKLPTDIEKFRAIYIWVCSNIENDFEYYKKNKYNREKLKNDSVKLLEWNKEFTKKGFNKLLKEKKTVCTGYAYLIKELSNFTNINCEIVNGYGRTATDNIGVLSVPNHSWNAVQLNKKWYLCDATWSSGIYILNDYKFEFKYNDGYFLANPELFIKNHYPLESKWQLIEKKIDDDAFLNGPIVYGETFKQNILPIQPSKLKLEINQNEEINFLLKIKDSINIDFINFEITSGTYKTNFKPKTNYTKDGFLQLNCSFKNRGLYDLHLKINNDYILTYIINVKRHVK